MSFHVHKFSLNLNIRPILSGGTILRNSFIMLNRFLIGIGFVCCSLINAGAQCDVLADLGKDTTICAGSSLVLDAAPLRSYLCGDSLQIIYDATQGVSGLAGASRVYMHAGAETEQFGGWQYTTGNWGLDDGIGLMDNIGSDLWQITIHPGDYFGYPEACMPEGIWMVFRNADGSQTGKDPFDSDIYVWLRPDQPQSLFHGVGANRLMDANVTYTWSDNSHDPTILVNSPGIYSVLLEGAGGCQHRDTIEIGLNPDFGLSPLPDTAFCDVVNYWAVPQLAVSYFEDSLIIEYDATQGVSGLAGAPKVYFHAAAELHANAGWQYTVGNWGLDDGIGLMDSVGPELWQIIIHPQTYFGYSPDSSLHGILMVFRNADGSLTGKDGLDLDIWLDTKNDPPSSAFNGISAAWKTDNIDVLWSTGSTNNNLDISSPGTYWLQLSHENGGCLSRDSFMVTSGVDFGPDIQACSNGPGVTLDAGPGFFSYIWSTGASGQAIQVAASNDYWVTAVDGSACQASDTIHVDINAPLSVELGNDTTTCDTALIWLTPAIATTRFDDSVVIIYDATKGVSGLGGANKVYMHAGAELHTLGGWQYVTGNWGLDDGIGLMENIGTDLWKITIEPVSYFGYPVDSILNGIFMVFRNADGTLTGKDDLDMDIWVDMKNDPIVSGFNGVGLSWKKDAIDQILWSTGAKGDSLAVTQSGEYWVDVSDTAGCTASDTIKVVQGVDLGPDTLLCPGGSLTLSAGSGYQTYSWSTGASTAGITVDQAASYWVAVVDGNACPASDTIIIDHHTLPALDLGNDTVFCANTFLVNLDAGPDFGQYDWSTGSTGQTIGVSESDTVTIQVTDTNGCVQADSIAILADPLPDAYAGPDTSVCPGASIQLNASGGVNYSWTPADFLDMTNISNPVATPDSTIDYVVTVTDINNCKAQDAITVVVPDSLSLSFNTTDASCAGSFDGSIDLMVANGLPPYQYSWSTGSTAQDINGLNASDYPVQVSDAANCIALDTATIGEPDPIIASFTTTDASCSGNPDGSLDLTVTGGSPGYQYSWSNGSTQEDLNNIIAGQYYVTITDNQLCEHLDSVTLDAIISIDLTIIGADLLCYGDSDGSADLTVAGGTPPYDYSWSHGPTTEDVIALTAGTYTVQATDDNSCFSIDAVTIMSPDSLAAAFAATAVSCSGGNDGELDLTVTGGVAPYDYSWNTGSTLEDLTGLSAGFYAVTITDDQSCTQFDTLTLTEINPMISNIIPGHVSCNGESDGFANLSVSGGTSPFSFSWSNSGTTEDISSLSAGSYKVWISDSNACQMEDSIMVNQPAAIVPVFSLSPVTCFGDADGWIDLTLTGGTSPFSYSWSNGSSDEDPTQLTAGLYTLQITDSAGCQRLDSALVPEPDKIQTMLDLTHATCNLANGSVTVQTTGGTAPYEYSWDSGDTSSVFVQLTAGTYYLTIFDDQGCTAMDTAIIGDAGSPVITLDSVVDISCNGLSDGAIYVHTGGGTQPYTYSWSNALTTEDLLNIPSGNYQLTVTDSNNCEETFTETVFQPAKLIVMTTTDSSGNASAHIDGGTPPYQYEWDNQQTTSSATGLIPGIHTVMVTDGNDCMATDTFEMAAPDGIQLPGSLADIRVHPNPNNGMLMINMGRSADAQIIVMDILGKIVYQNHSSDIRENNRLTIDLTGQPNGVYLVRINAPGQMISRKVEILR